MSNPKTIIHFSQDFTKGKPQLGGYSRIYNICSDANRHIIYTISTEITAVEEYFIDAIKVVQIPVKERPSGLFNQFKLYKPIGRQIVNHLQITQVIPDLFFGHSHQGNFLILQYVKNKLFPKKKILWEANGIGGCPKVKGTLKQRLANKIQYLLQGYVFKKCDVIVAQTPQSKEFISKEFSVNVNKITVIPNAIVTVNNNREGVRLKRENKKPKILCFGLFDQLNGIPFLLEVIKENKLSEIEFVFAGFGKYVKEVENLASMASNITFLGQLPYKKMMEKLPEHDFLIIPRLNTLGSQLYIPTKLLEGMYLGVVPICADVEGMTCVVTNNETGLVFKSASKEELITTLNKVGTINQSTYANLQNNAIEKVAKEYNWINNFKKLNLLYLTASN